MESVEHRRLMAATVASWSDDSVSSIYGGYFGCVEVGDNGSTYGYPTTMAGTGGDITGWDYSTWDADISDGLDSGYVDFQMSVNADGQGAGTIQVGDDSDATTFASGSSGSIGQVTIQAAVGGQSMMMAWQNVKVYFYKGGQLVETVEVGGLSADTLNATGYGGAESIASISTNASDYDGVRIEGQVRLVAAQGIYPSMRDIFGQVAIS
jgi:hypothetical protein